MGNAEKQQTLEKKAVVQTKELYKGKVFSLKHDHLEFPNGHSQDWDIIDHPGSVALIPITEKGNFILVEQYRRAIHKLLLELPAGTLTKGEIPSSCAQRELQEETGFRANNLLPFGGIYSSPGFCTEYIHFFIARDLEKSPLPKDVNEAIDVVEISPSAALDLIASGKIVDVKTIAGILFYENLYGKK